MMILERKITCPIFGTWKRWEAKNFFDKTNSENPKLEALQAFEEIKPTDFVKWRVIQNGRLLIEHR